uniref:DNA mismatch repair protein MutS core domain-containing protein n=1 Tax=Ciona intestinalis TaxID=7719 RepID=F7BB99_CIOIN
MAHRKPKYRYGLLETPETSDFGDETTLQSSTVCDSTFHKTIEQAGPSNRANISPFTPTTPKCNYVFVAKSNFQANSSDNCTPKNRVKLSHNFTDRTLLASDEASTSSKSSTPVFQVPSGYPPKRVGSFPNVAQRTPIFRPNSRYYCLAASAALIKYVEFVQNTIYASESLRIVFKGSEQTTLIDAGTSSVLELAVNLNDPKSDQSLYGVLNHTKTQGGSRLLRCNVLQPPNDVETIQGRLDCVEDLS